MNIAEGIQLDRVLRGTREFSAELVMLEHMFDHRRMGWQNPPLPWSELERRLAGRPPPANQPPGDGGDAPAWSSKIPTSRPQRPRSGATRVGGAVGRFLCRAALPFQCEFSGWGSHPEELAEEAARLGLEALAITDHDGMYGIVRFAEAAQGALLPTIFGAELTLTPAGAPAASGARTGTPDPAGEHLVVLARGPEGYARLSRAISEAQMAGAKGAPGASWGGWPGCTAGTRVVLTGCRKGAVPSALHWRGPAAAEAELDRLVQAFGRGNVYVELWDHKTRSTGSATTPWSGWPTGRGRGGGDQQRPLRHPVPPPPGHRPGRGQGPQPLADLDGWLPAGAGAHLRSGFEQAARLARYPGTVELAAELGRDLAFDLELVAPACPTSRSRRATPR